MKIQELEKKLVEMEIPLNAYSLKGGLPNEAFCIGKQGSNWEVYYSERVEKVSKKEFQSEDEACEFFHEWMRKIFKKQ
ncbi:MAG: hypothetical protein K0R15_2584 [Clostridiales bacterium]|jgi:hypothetical protein|nr:hypothetical protein [Clostridiales bacterium]